MICLATLAIYLAILLTPASTFIPKDTIRIIVNKVAPYSNPTESYRYYDLPFCRPAQIHEEEQTLGENLTGNRKMTSGYEAEFATNAKKKLLCKEIFSNDQLKEFRNAIDRNYIFEMFVEDFIVGNMVGHVKENKYFLATHLNFNILYNKALGKIIKATVDYDHLLNTTEITAPTGPSFPKELEFTYSIKWHETSLEHPTINNGYESFFTDEIHWFSFLNALILTTFFVLLIWRIFQRIQKTELINTAVDVEGERRDDELNWKMIRSEIFKLPPYHNLLCAALGNGTTLIIITLCICLMGAIGKFYHFKGYILTSAITLFAIMSIVGGYVSGKYHRFLGGNGWIYNIILTALLVPLPVFILIMTLNNIAWAQQATTALPFSSVVYSIIIVVIVGFPLLTVGNIFARITNEVTLNDSKELISHTSKGSKPMPSLSIYHNTFLTVFIAGLFPFSAMHVELYYLFSTMWGHKIYTMYGMVFIIFVMILNMTACVSIILTYFQLNALDHKWWWRSFFYGGSSAFYVFLYAVYFLITKTEITGFFQISYYLGYSTLLSLFLFLMMGSAGFIASSAFVRQIYERSKID